MKKTMMEQINTHAELASLYLTLSWTWLASHGVCKEQ